MKRLRRKDPGTWWSVGPGGHQPDAPNPTGAPRRISEHALLRYLQRYVMPHVTTERITDYTNDDRSRALEVLRRNIRLSEFVDREHGTQQTIWRMPNGILFVVLDDLVKTVLSENRKGYRAP